MGIFTRPDSKYWWLWLETAPPGQQKVRTDIVVGRTVTQRHDSKALAVQAYHARMSDIARRRHRLPPKPTAMTFKTYAKTYDETVIAHHRGVERERRLLIHLQAFFDRDALTHIDRERVQAYQAARLTASPKPSKNTVNREVDLLKSMLRDAVPKYLEASPLARMPRMKAATRPKRVLTADEEMRLLEVAKADAQDYAILVVGLDTLVRQGDLVNLKRADRQGVWLLIPDPKTSLPYHVPLSPRAAAALDAIPDTGAYYFAKFRRAENPRDWRGSVRQRLEWLCSQCSPKVPYGYLTGITFHGATRKTGATRRLIRDKKDLATVQRLGGWKNPEMLLRIYAEATRDDLLEAVGQPKEQA